MKFAGQVKVPDVDHPGVPASFVVDEDHAEMLLDGESLGRWSLHDVQASRLIASAFSVRFGPDEEITFIADDPIEFAYKGVEHMAERWARYKSMTFPRRMVTVARSRRDVVPSRIQELKEAMEENLHQLHESPRPAEPEIPVRSPETIRRPQPESPPVEAPDEALETPEPEISVPSPETIRGPQPESSPVEAPETPEATEPTEPTEP